LWRSVVRVANSGLIGPLEFIMGIHVWVINMGNKLRLWT
jgi:hypothetical protein